MLTLQYISNTVSAKALNKIDKQIYFWKVQYQLFGNHEKETYLRETAQSVQILGGLNHLFSVNRRAHFI